MPYNPQTAQFWDTASKVEKLAEVANAADTLAEPTGTKAFMTYLLGENPGRASLTAMGSLLTHAAKRELFQYATQDQEPEANMYGRMIRRYRWHKRDDSKAAPILPAPVNSLADRVTILERKLEELRALINPLG